MKKIYAKYQQLTSLRTFFTALSLYISACLFFTITIQCIDNAHFWRANYLWDEPRLEEPWLATWDLSAGWGSTRKAFNNNAKEVPLLCLYGTYPIARLGAGVQTLNPETFYDRLLKENAALPLRDLFGNLQFYGKFNIIEGIVSAYQNLTHGFFIQAYLPVRSLKTSAIWSKDLSPTDGIFPNRATPEWQELLKSLATILTHRGINLNSNTHSGCGDFSLLAGWAYNHEETTTLDYIDVSAKIGILFPCAKKAHPTKPFQLPLGYNGHWGLPAKFDISFGALDWLTIGFHTGALFLFERTKTISVKTAQEQKGLIFLQMADVKIDPGTLWDISTYIKADHFVRGLSLTVGYSYNHRDKDSLTPLTPEISGTLANSDERYKGWTMHVLHSRGDYDFSHCRFAPGWRIGFFYNYILGGVRIFDTNMKAGNLGMDITLRF